MIFHAPSHSLALVWAPPLQNHTNTLWISQLPVSYLIECWAGRLQDSFPDSWSSCRRICLSPRTPWQRHCRANGLEWFSLTVRYTSPSTQYRKIWANRRTHTSKIWFKPLWYLNQETLTGIAKLWIQPRSMLAVQLWCTLTRKCLVGSTPSSLSLANVFYLEDLSNQHIQPEVKLGITHFPSCNQMPESTCLKAFLVSFYLLSLSLIPHPSLRTALCDLPAARYIPDLSKT